MKKMFYRYVFNEMIFHLMLSLFLVTVSAFYGQKVTLLMVLFPVFAGYVVYTIFVVVTWLLHIRSYFNKTGEHDVRMVMIRNALFTEKEVIACCHRKMVRMKYTEIKSAVHDGVFKGAVKRYSENLSDLIRLKGKDKRIMIGVSKNECSEDILNWILIKNPYCDVKFENIQKKHVTLEDLRKYA